MKLIQYNIYQFKFERIVESGGSKKSHIKILIYKTHLKKEYFITFIILLQISKMSQQSQETKQKQGTPQSPLKLAADSKKGYEHIFKTVFILATVLSAMLLKKVYQFQTMPEFEKYRNGSIIDMLYYSIPFCIFFTSFDTLVHYLFDDFFLKSFLTPEKYQGNFREKRAQSLVKWSYSIVYYFFSSLAAYLLIKETNFFPTWLGGHGACINIVEYAPAQPEATHGMKVFYLIQFGKHLSRLLTHMFIKQDGNFYEYTLHHALSAFLLFYSYLTNLWLVGIMVLLCHDITDFFFVLARTYRDYKHFWNPIALFINVVGMIVWVGGRIVAFPACCVYPGLVGPGMAQHRLTDLQKEIFLPSVHWMTYMLSALYILQIFWTYYLAKAFVVHTISPKLASHTYVETS